MSRTYNDIYDTNANNKVVNKNGEETSFLYGDLQERVQVVNAKSINSNTAYVSVNENNAVRVDVRRVPSKFTVFDENSGETTQFDGSAAIQINLPEVITRISYEVSPRDGVPTAVFVEGEHYLDFVYGLGAFERHVYISLKPIQNLIKAEERRATQAEELLQTNIDTEIARAEGAESRLNDALGDEVTRATGAENTLRTNINTINSYIMAGTDSDNQLANKDFVNSSIQNMAAFYVTYDAQGNPFPTKQALVNSTQVYIDGELKTSIGHNDYCIVIADESKHETAGDPTTRYIYQGMLDEPYDASKWGFQYIINNSGLTAEQLAAINSGITAQLVNKFNAYETNKQDTLVSGTNIKTINGQSVLGEGNIQVEGVTNYDDLRSGKPIINADLNTLSAPVNNTYYRHTGITFNSKDRIDVGDLVDEIIFDSSIAIEDMNVILDNFNDAGFIPFVDDGEVKAWILCTVDASGNEYQFILERVTGEHSPSEAEVLYMILGIDGTDSETQHFIYLSSDANIDGQQLSAGWHDTTIELEGTVSVYNYKSYLNKFIYVEGEPIQQGLIYLYRNNEFTLDDYNLSFNRPIINADVTKDDVKNGEYYKQTVNALKVESFVDGNYYYRIGFTKESDHTKVVNMFETLHSNVTPDYVGMQLSGSDSKAVRYDKMEEYISQGYSLTGANYWILLSPTSRDNFPELLSNFIPVLLALEGDGQYAIQYFSLFSIWTNFDFTFNNNRYKKYTWIGQEGNIFANIKSDYLPTLSLTGGVSSKLYTFHQEYWDDFFVADLDKIDKGIIGRQVNDEFKPLLTDETKELPQITSIGKVLESSGDGEFDFYFIKDEADGKYKHTLENKAHIFANVNQSVKDTTDAMMSLFTSIGQDIWHIEYIASTGESSSDVTDIYFYQDTTIQDNDGNYACLLATKIRQNQTLTPVFSNYATTYTFDGYSVEITEIGWQTSGDEGTNLIAEYSGSYTKYLYYNAPSTEVPADTYGKIITTTYIYDENDFSFIPHVLFYGEVANPRAEWVDIDIPEGGGLPDYSEAKNNDALKIKVTPAVTAFSPEISIGDSINNIYILRDSALLDFTNYDTNSTYYGVYPETCMIEMLVTGTLGGDSNVSRYVSVRGLSIEFGGQSVSLLYTGYRTTDSETVTQADLIYQNESGNIEWGTHITNVDDFSEIIRYTIETILGFTNYTTNVTLVFEQDKWRIWMGSSMNLEVVEPEKKEVVWDSVFPKIIKSGQYLVSDCEAYSFDFTRNSSSDYRCSISATGKLYFNTDLEDEEVQSTVSSLLSMYSSSQTFKQWMFFAKDSSNTRLFPYWGFVSGDNDAYAIIAMDSQNAIYQIWANIDGDFTISGQPVGLNCHVGWDLANIETYTSWTNASYLQYTSPNAVIPSSAYGKLMSLQDGLFYGDVKNPKTIWKDLEVSSNLSEINVDYNNITKYDSSSTNPDSLIGLRYGDSDRVTRYGANSVKSWLNVGATNGSFTVYSSDWTSSGDEYYVTKSISGLTDDYGLIVAPSSQSSAKLAQEANIYYAYSDGSTLYIYCTTKPESTIGFNYTIIK